jgi:hypothetical protein
MIEIKTKGKVQSDLASRLDEYGSLYTRGMREADQAIKLAENNPLTVRITLVHGPWTYNLELVHKGSGRELR